MIIDIRAALDYGLKGTADILLQIEAAGLSDQRFIDPQISTGPVDHFRRIAAEDGIGERIWVRATDRFSCEYRASVDISRQVEDVANLVQTPVHELPDHTIKYLMASRFCPSDEFQSFVAAEFADIAGGARIAVMRDFIEQHFDYVPGSSSAQTTALDTFVQRQGICRDFAHVMVTLARASAVPARFASVYSPGVTPPDFHAVAEVFLDGGWHLVDATGMASAEDIAIIGVGRDAADVAFMTSYGAAVMNTQSVEVTART